MTSTRSPRRALLINLALFAVGFGLLGVVIYRNLDEIKKVFRNPWIIASSGSAWRST